MIIFQLLLTGFAFLMIYIARLHYRRGSVSKEEFSVWMVVWGGLIALSLFPQSLRSIADTLHIGRIFDLLAVIAFAILGLVVFMTRLSVLELQKKIEKIVRVTAIAHVKKNSKLK